MRIRLTPLVTLCTLATGCDGVPGLPTACTDDLMIKYTPRDTVVAVGQTYQATIELFGCRGSKKLSDMFSWASTDTTVVTVITGPTFLGDNAGQRAIVTARAPGAAAIIATGIRFTGLGGALVTVLGADVRAAP